MTAVSSWLSAIGDTNPITGLTFLTATGSIIPPQEQIDRVVYPAVEGAGFYFKGKRGEPFDIVTEVDATSFENARAGIGVYADITGQQLDFFYLGYLLGTVLIHKVIELETKATGQIVGGTNGNRVTGGYLKAQWTFELLV